MISVVTPCRTLLSAFGLIGRTKSEWVLMSMKPGVTARPSASMTLLASPGREGPMAAMRPAARAISAMVPWLPLPSMRRPRWITISQAMAVSVAATPARLCGGGDADRSGAVERLVAADCHAVAIALIGIVVPQRMVLYAPVVPKGNGVRLPLEAAGQLRRLDVLVEHLHYRGAFVALQADDARGEAAVDVERLATGHRMGSHDRLLRLGEHLAFVVHPVAAPVDMLAFVHGGHAGQHLLDRLAQGLVGAVHVGEHRVAAAIRGHHLQMQDRAHRRLDVARDVGMPDLAGDVLGGFVGLDQQDFGMPLDRAPAGWMDMQLAELAAEVGVLVDAELLVSKEDHQVVHQRVVDLLELLVAQRFGQVDTVDLGADHWRHLAHLDGLVAHGVVPTVAISFTCAVAAVSIAQRAWH